MNTHVEHRTTVRPGVLVLLDKFNALMIAKFKASRARQIERAELEALEALGPEVLDDIGITVVKTGNPPRPMAVCSPHVIATSALYATQSKERGKF